jgi:hypothetical protein
MRIPRELQDEVNEIFKIRINILDIIISLSLYLYDLSKTRISPILSEHTTLGEITHIFSDKQSSVTHRKQVELLNTHFNMGGGGMLCSGRGIE